MSKPLRNNLQELVEANIISADTAQRITDYYESKKDTSTNKFNLVLGILGAILVGSGVILLIAHNWDNLNKFTKTLFAFLPLAITQAVCLYTILRKKDNKVWQESSAVLLFFTVPAAISVISQIYHINGSLSGFLLTWICLTIPLIYLPASSLVSLLSIALLTWFAVEEGYPGLFSNRIAPYPYLYALLLLTIIPHYYRLATHNRNSNFFHLHNWFLAISLCITLGAFAGEPTEVSWLSAGYISLFGLYYLLGQSVYFSSNKLLANPFLVLGLAGMLFIMMVFTYESPWRGIGDLQYKTFYFLSPLSYITIGFLIGGFWLIFKNLRETENKFDPAAYSAVLFCLLLFAFASNTNIGIFIFNSWILAIAVYFIRKGSLQNHLGILNFGLLIISILTLLRFFDDSIPFIWRGIFFVAAGAGFFAANYLLLKRRKMLTQNSHS
jgi:uncharacterized membrane protein